VQALLDEHRDAFRPATALARVLSHPPTTTTKDAF
jgi:hypothetical protein